jgi:hypothetical protein
VKTFAPGMGPVERSESNVPFRPCEQGYLCSVLKVVCLELVSFTLSPLPILYNGNSAYCKLLIFLFFYFYR